jgi:hypothetical protein
MRGQLQRLLDCFDRVTCYLRRCLALAPEHRLTMPPIHIRYQVGTVLLVESYYILIIVLGAAVPCRMSHVQWKAKSLYVPSLIPLLNLFTFLF